MLRRSVWHLINGKGGDLVTKPIWKPLSHHSGLCAQSVHKSPAGVSGSCVPRAPFATSQHVEKRHASKTDTLDSKILQLLTKQRLKDAVEHIASAKRTAGVTRTSRAVGNALVERLKESGDLKLFLDLCDTWGDMRGMFIQHLSILCQDGEAEKVLALVREEYHNITSTRPRHREVFTALTNTVLLECPQHMDVILGFVAQQGYEEFLGLLWRCFILTGRFDEADAMLADREKAELIRPSINPHVVNVTKLEALTVSEDSWEAIYVHLLLLPDVQDEKTLTEISNQLLILYCKQKSKNAENLLQLMATNKIQISRQRFRNSVGCSLEDFISDNDIVNKDYLLETFRLAPASDDMPNSS